MRVKLHCVSHDIRYFVVSSVVHAFHGVQYAPLHWLQSVLDVWHCPFENYIRGIIKKPVLIHAAQMVYDRCVKPVDRLVVGVLLNRVLFDGAIVFNIVYFVAHEVNAVFLQPQK